MKLFRITLWMQAVYTFVTAVWPLVDIKSFLFVTGPKTDIWLVKTVAAILIPIALCFFAHLFIRTNHWPVAILASTSAMALASIDFYYYFNGTIKWVYAVDGVLQVMFLIGWVYLMVSGRPPLHKVERG